MEHIYALVGFIVGFIVGIGFVLSIEHDKIFGNKDPVKNDPFKIPERSKKPLYFKLNNFSDVYIKVIDYDDYHYKYVSNGRLLWNKMVEIKRKEYIKRIYTQINFDPLK